MLPLYFREAAMESRTSGRILAMIKPSVFGYLRKYAAAFTPLIIYYCLRLLLLLPPVRSFCSRLFWALANLHLGVIIGNIIGSAYSFLFILPVLLVVLVVAWVTRSREVLASSLIAFLLPALLAVNRFRFKVATGNWEFDFSMALVSFLVGYAEMFETCAWLGGLAVLAAVELSRKSITYTITDTSVIIRGGIWRRQEQILPYSSIGRIVLEQSLLGRLLGYGTVILVSSANWGSEYYTRGLDVETGSRHVKVGIFYARTLSEMSRDPLKCLYGIRHPSRIKELIEKVLEAYARAPLEQTKYLREIRDKLYEERH